jgi:hypothetical protein
VSSDLWGTCRLLFFSQVLEGLGAMDFLSIKRVIIHVWSIELQEVTRTGVFNSSSCLFSLFSGRWVKQLHVRGWYSWLLRQGLRVLVKASLCPALREISFEITYLLTFNFLAQMGCKRLMNLIEIWLIWNLINPMGSVCNFQRRLELSVRGRLHITWWRLSLFWFPAPLFQ